MFLIFYLHVMASTLFFLVLLVTVVVEPIALGVPVANNDVDESCEAQFWENGDPYKCSGGLSINLDCKSGMAHLAHTNISKTCTEVKLFWSYPMNNLTMFFETPFTKQQQAYTLEFDNKKLAGIGNIYRLIDGKETEVTTHDSKLIQHSDSNYQVILKFQGPPEMISYGAFVYYNVTRP